MMNLRSYEIYLIGFVISLPLKVWGKYCEDGQYCSPAQDCCPQGCCFTYSPATSHDHVFNLFFYGHWYFWCVVGAACAVLVCGCALWRRRGELCRSLACPALRQRARRVPSDRDSAGSCYPPPQYSRCSSFHYPAPPPYTEVTSKPDLYPLVIAYGDGGDKGGSNYLMVQYFRNYFVRPSRSLSATSTAESLSSSFICNATNEANTIIPPPYSCSGNFDEWRAGSSAPGHRQAMLRSISSVTCQQPGTPRRRPRAPRSTSSDFQDVPLSGPQGPQGNANTTNDQSREHHNRNASAERTNNCDPSTSPDAANTINNVSVEINNFNPNSSTPSSSNSDNVSHIKSPFNNRNGSALSLTLNRRSAIINQSDDETLPRDSHFNNLDNRNINKVQNNSWTDVFFTKAFKSNNCDKIRMSEDGFAHRVVDKRNIGRQISNRSPDDLNNTSAVFGYSPIENADVSTMYKEHQQVNKFSNIPACDSKRLNSVMLMTLGDKNDQPHTSNFFMDFSSQANAERSRRYYDSISGSDDNSLANVENLESTSRATGAEDSKEIHHKFHRLTAELREELIPTTHITYNSESYKVKRNSVKGRKKSLYMPLSKISNYKNASVSKSPTGISSVRTVLKRKGWLSKSAPSTPCENSLVPNLLSYSQKKISSSGLATKILQQIEKGETNPLLADSGTSKDDDVPEGQF